MTNHSYVLVANQTEAALYAFVNSGKNLEKHGVWENEFARQQDSDIYTDRPGQLSAPSGHVQGVDSISRKNAAELEAERFAAKLAEELDGLRKRSQINTLDIVCGPSFLGKLRNEMNPQLENCVDEIVSKNLGDASEQTIIDYVKKRK